jgi:hypothetical protein
MKTRVQEAEGSRFQMKAVEVKPFESNPAKAGLTPFFELNLFKRS